MKKKIGDILLEKKYIDNTQLNTALKKQKEDERFKNKKIGEVLKELGFITDEKVKECLHIQNFYDLLYQNCIKYGVDINSTPKDLYWNILTRIENEKEENDFMSEICKILNIEKYTEGLKYTVDNKMLNKIGINKLMSDYKNLYIPVIIEGTKHSRVLSANPYVNLPIYAPIVLTPRTVLLKIINSLNVGDKETTDAKRLNVDSIDIEMYLQKLLEKAMINNVSDVHIEWNLVKRRTEIKYRKDGLLEMIDTYASEDFHERLLNKIFEFSKINTSDYLKIHDERMVLETMGKKIPIRVSAVPVTKNKEGGRVSNVVLRLLYDRENIGEDGSHEDMLKNLGYSQSAIKEFMNFLRMPFGMIILCGPTGSGKTTTLYSLLKIKKREPLKIVTIEDPVETTIDGLTQVNVDPSNDISFFTAAKAFLRHDPDVILIGEIRDIETAKEACNMAMTGHLVFSTLHANTSSVVIPRLLGIGIDRQILASTLKVIIAQRLVRKLCNKCKIKIKYSDLTNSDEIKKILKVDDIENYKMEYKHIFTDASGNVDKYFVYYPNPSGCLHCKSTGYNGRTVVWEILKNTLNIQSIIVDEKALITETVLFKGQEATLFKNVSIDRIREGYTTISEVERFIPLGKTISTLY